MKQLRFKCRCYTVTCVRSTSNKASPLILFHPAQSNCIIHPYMRLKLPKTISFLFLFTGLSLNNYVFSRVDFVLCVENFLSPFVHLYTIPEQQTLHFNVPASIEPTKRIRRNCGIDGGLERTMLTQEVHTLLLTKA